MIDYNDNYQDDYEDLLGDVYLDDYYVCGKSDEDDRS